MESLLAKPGATVLPIHLKQAFQDLMWRRAGVKRTGEGIQKGLFRLSDIRESLHKDLGLSHGPKPYHMELQDAVETKLMLDLGEIILTAAGKRKESRGAHFREDFPEQKKDWNTNLVVSNREDGLHCEKRIKQNS